MTNSLTTVGPRKLASRLIELIPMGEPILITGRPGIGKTDIVDTATATLGYDIVYSYAVTSDPTDYKGIPYAAQGVAEFLPVGVVKQLIAATKPTVCFLDDIGPAPTSVQAALMQMVLARRVEGYKIPDCVTFVAATNRREDNAGVGGIIDPLKGRFSIFKLEPNLDDWVNWALNIPDFPIELIAAVRFRPQWVEEWKPTKAIENVPTPRNIAKVGKFIAKGLGGTDLYASRIGESAAIELQAFLKMFTQLPNITEIVQNPMGAPVPTTPDAQHAICAALTSKVNTLNFGAVCEYVGRLPVEFEAFYMSNIAFRKRELTQEVPYIKWASKHGNDITNND